MLSREMAAWAGWCVLVLLAASSKGWECPRDPSFFVGITVVPPGDEAGRLPNLFGRVREREIVSSHME